jgi:F-type H+-transporting ATPase subunit b
MLQFDPGLTIWTVVIFLFLVALLGRLAWKPLVGALEERTKRINDSLAKASEAERAAQNARAEYEAMIGRAAKEAQEMIARSRKAAESTRDEVLAKAQTDADQLLQRTKREIDLARQKALDEIKQTAAELSINIAGRIISRSLVAKDHQDLIRQALGEMQNLSGEPN